MRSMPLHCTLLLVAQVICGSAAPDLLFIQDGRWRVSMQSNPVPHVAVDDDGPAFEHTDRDAAPRLTLPEVEYQCLAHDRRLEADCNPLVVSASLDDDVAKDPYYAFRLFH
jgi:hypothetical protein